MDSGIGAMCLTCAKQLVIQSSLISSGGAISNSSTPIWTAKCSLEGFTESESLQCKIIRYEVRMLITRIPMGNNRSSKIDDNYSQNSCQIWINLNHLNPTKLIKLIKPIKLIKVRISIRSSWRFRFRNIELTSWTIPAMCIVGATGHMGRHRRRER